MVEAPYGALVLRDTRGLSSARLDKASEEEFRSHKAAWQFFKKQAPSYRQVAIWWVVSAKKEETRRKRLARLIAGSVNLLRL